jgi:Formin Homology 2 Domain
VKNAAERDGKQGSILDLDPTKSISSQMQLTVKGRTQLKKKKRVRRKKIYWNPLDSGQIKANSLWSSVKGRLQMSQLKYDEKEFADLFTESADPADKKKKPEKQDAGKAKKSQQVIDGKRSMNGGIILARLKVNYERIAEMVDSMYVCRTVVHFHLDGRISHLRRSF